MQNLRGAITYGEQSPNKVPGANPPPVSEEEWAARREKSKQVAQDRKMIMYATAYIIAFIFGFLVFSLSKSKAAGIIVAVIIAAFWKQLLIIYALSFGRGV